MINNLAFQLVFFRKKRELYRLGNQHGIAILYFFALMQKSNKKINPPRRIDFLTADVDHFKHFLFKGTKHLL